MTTAAIPATPARIRAVPAAAKRPGLRFTAPWLARYARPDELSRLLASGGLPARLLLIAARPGYARLERRAFAASRPVHARHAPNRIPRSLRGEDHDRQNSHTP